MAQREVGKCSKSVGARLLYRYEHAFFAILGTVVYSHVYVHGTHATELLTQSLFPLRLTESRNGYKAARGAFLGHGQAQVSLFQR